MVFRLVNPLMSHQVAMNTKTAFALFALKGFFASVNPHMCNQVAAMIKTTFALVTLKGFFASVNSNVCNHITSMIKSFSTVLTLIWFDTILAVHGELWLVGWLEREAVDTMSGRELVFVYNSSALRWCQMDLANFLFLSFTSRNLPYFLFKFSFVNQCKIHFWMHGNL